MLVPALAFTVIVNGVPTPPLVGDTLKEPIRA
jgi:hypothetical protein